MARTRQTARKAPSQARAAKGAGKRAPTKSAGKQPRKTPKNPDGVKKPRKPRAPNQPPKRTVARVVTDEEIPQYNNFIFKVWNHLKNNPTPQMMRAARQGYEGDEVDPSDDIIKAEIRSCRMTSQFLKTTNDYVVLGHLKPAMDSINAWNPRRRKGKTITLRRVLASLPFLYTSAEEAYETREAIMEAVEKFKDSHN